MGGFIMLVNYIVGIAIFLCLAALYWILRGLVLSPVKGGEHSKLCVNIEVNGEEPKLEHILKGLIWLRDNGTLKADVSVNATEPDANTRLVALAFSQDYQFISYKESGE